MFSSIMIYKQYTVINSHIHRYPRYETHPLDSDMLRDAGKTSPAPVIPWPFAAPLRGNAMTLERTAGGLFSAGVQAHKAGDLRLAEDSHRRKMGVSMGKFQENHRKTIGPWWFHVILWDIPDIPLVMTNSLLSKHGHRKSGFTEWTWWFSIVM